MGLECKSALPVYSAPTREIRNPNLSCPCMKSYYKVITQTGLIFLSMFSLCVSLYVLSMYTILSKILPNYEPGALKVSHISSGLNPRLLSILTAMPCGRYHPYSLWLHVQFISPLPGTLVGAADLSVLYVPTRYSLAYYPPGSHSSWEQEWGGGYDVSQHHCLKQK